MKWLVNGIIGLQWLQQVQLVFYPCVFTVLFFFTSYHHQFSISTAYLTVTAGACMFSSLLRMQGTHLSLIVHGHTHLIPWVKIWGIKKGLISSGNVNRKQLLLRSNGGFACTCFPKNPSNETWILSTTKNITNVYQHVDSLDQEFAPYALEMVKMNEQNNGMILKYFLATLHLF